MKIPRFIFDGLTTAAWKNLGFYASNKIVIIDCFCALHPDKDEVTDILKIQNAYEVIS
jgi:hypothetical protein